jgi:phenylpyruvate tautomerase PptA (4-oxalocrotonate tautomerase family)
MPLVRIALLEGKPESYRRTIGDAVHRAMIETIDVPEHDRFQIITEHPKTGFIFARQHPDCERTDSLVVIQITLNTGRTVEMKRAFYERVAELLNQGVALPKEDLFISLIEVDHENWYVV